MIIFTESFDGPSVFYSTGTGNKWNQQAGARVTSGRTGTNMAVTGHGGAGQGWMRQVLPSEEDSTWTYGIAINPSSLSSTLGPIFSLLSDNASTTHLSFAVQSDGSIKAFRGTTGGTLLGQTAAGVVVINQWRYLEFQCTLGASGSVVIRRDETTVLTLSGVNTKNGGTKTKFDTFAFADSIGAGTAVGYDDVYVTNTLSGGATGFLGAVHIEGHLPSGNGSHSAGVNDAGNSTNNYSHVNDNTNTTYVDEATTGTEDTYTYGASAFPTGNTVVGVMVQALAQKTDANARSLSLVARAAGGTETVTAAGETLINSTNSYQHAVFETEPGGAAWTVAKVNGAEFGTEAS